MARTSTRTAPCSSLRISALTYKSKRREVVDRLLSKNIPPRNGLKKRSTIDSLNPESFNLFAIVFSGLSNKSIASRASNVEERTTPTSTLSHTLPIGFARDCNPCSGARKGSATVWNSPGRHYENQSIALPKWAKPPLSPSLFF